MRKLFALALVLAAASLAAGCGGGGGGSNGTTTTAQSCAKDQLDLVNSGQLTVATGNPAYPPWFEGGTQKGSSWKINDPNNGKGFESAVTYAVAEQLGFMKPEVKWIAVPFNQTYRPGPKNFDFSIQQIAITPARAKAVDFSNPYFELSQSVVGLQGTPIASATTFSQLKKYKLGAAVGTTSYDYIVDNIKPDEKPAVYDDLNAVITALKNRQIDGLVTDFAGAYYIAQVQLPNGTIVGRLPTIGAVEKLGMSFEKGSSLVSCVNKSLAALRQNGTLARLEQQWIAGKAHAPLIKQS